MNAENMIVVSQLKGYGLKAQKEFLKIFDRADDFWKLSIESRKEVIESISDLRLNATQKGILYDSKNVQKALDEGKKIMDDCMRLDIMPVCIKDEAYPLRFKNLQEMPSVIYCKGSEKIVQMPETIGVIGARRCTAEGKMMTIRLVENHKDRKVVIVSGMAKGIDSYAHTAAIKNGMSTVAVLGNGLDICYPREHKKLMESIGENGLLLSEFPPGTAPLRYHFPLRNRLIAGLSDTLYVMEAGKKSGTNSTVDYANKYGKRIVI